MGEPHYSDVLIVGAGIAGVGAAYRMHTRNPKLSYTILERRAQVGGTWDLFRYPGVRSDSDINTLCFPWEPWTRPETIAEGAHIREYLEDAARKHGIVKHIEFNTYVRSANWDSGSATWTVRTEQNGHAASYRGRFLIFGTGYYNYDEPYCPDFSGSEQFAGMMVHPQHWPKSLDHAGKRVVVIGSGPTAVSLIPALTDAASQVTMLQRTPSYLVSLPKVEPTAAKLRKVLPINAAHWIVRWRNVLFEGVIWLAARKAPKFSKRLLRRVAERNLPAGYDIDTHFTPPYSPWDQRPCCAIDADLFKEIGKGRVEMVTDEVDRVDTAGIVLKSGSRIDADVIITATGLQLQCLGGATLSVDGETVDPHDRFIYRRHMLEGVPNAAWCIGYTNTSWTLGTEMAAKSFSKLVAYMNSHGYTHAYPHLGSLDMAEQPAWHLDSGYVKRGLHVLPRSGTRRPWKMSHNYLRDVLGRPFERVDDSMVFGRVACT